LSLAPSSVRPMIMGASLRLVGLPDERAFTLSATIYPS
jgi:hypothetical protein